MSSWRGRVWWVGVGPILGTLLGVVDSVVNHVPAVLGEVGTARAERGAWSQTAEFASLILDAGWAWAAAAVLAGWLVSRHARPVAGMVRGALAGGLTLLCATTAYYGADLLFDGGSWWGWVTRYWLIGSVLLGPPLGAVGALIRRPGAIGAVAALVVPAGAALQMVLLPPPPDSRMAGPVQWSIWIAAAAAIVLILRGSGRRDRVLGTEHAAPQPGARGGPHRAAE
ncbi:DUF6518 family protein [Actinoplanes sp. GCM10030250]|uniref:DUF6518 family protein n=1 Tax=Actinoplanes sp. GCM10030250 TaxID=3273376 RepID=UPI00360FFDB7